jgi:hypothetical protein
VERRQLKAALLSLLVGAALASSACTLHIGRVDLNRPLNSSGYEAIALGSDTRREVLSRLGPPDALLYTPTELVFDYLASRHRATDLELFVPSDIVPGALNPASLLSVPRYFFDPFAEPEETDETFLEATGRRGVQLAVGFIPFASGEELLVVNGRQIRVDRLRVVFDRESLVATRKALRLASGEFSQDALGERVLLQAD